MMMAATVAPRTRFGVMGRQRQTSSSRGLCWAPTDFVALAAAYIMNKVVTEQQQQEEAAGPAMQAALLD